MVNKNIGIVSYNINCNFTNYGSALQSWALSESIKKLGYRPVLIDYCPNILKDKDPLDPMKNMWDTDEESRKLCELSLPAIRINYAKFEAFYSEKFNRTGKKYFSDSFNDVVNDENITGFVCGSDTIFCIDEFGIDDGYYANYPCMRGHSISYAASFGDSHFDENSYKLLDSMLHNFKAISIRESGFIPYIEERVSVPVKKVLDPTLLLEVQDFETIEAPQIVKEPYILLYARRYNSRMFDYADKLAKEFDCKVVDISLRAINADHHDMFYEAGVEEFLSLVHHAKFVVTNSFHGMIVSVHYRKPFVVFSREQCDTKIDEVLELFGLSDRKLISGIESFADIDYDKVHQNIATARKDSIEFLSNGLNKL